MKIVRRIAAALAALSLVGALAACSAGSKPDVVPSDELPAGTEPAPGSPDDAAPAAPGDTGAAAPAAEGYGNDDPMKALTDSLQQGESK